MISNMKLVFLENFSKKKVRGEWWIYVVGKQNLDIGSLKG